MISKHFHHHLNIPKAIYEVLLPKFNIKDNQLTDIEYRTGSFQIFLANELLIGYLYNGLSVKESMKKLKTKVNTMSYKSVCQLSLREG